MKKTLYAAAAVLLFSSCSGNNNADNEKNDTENQVEQSELTDAAVNAAAEEQVNLDSIMNAQIDAEFKKGLSVKAGKEKVVNLPEGTATKMTLPFVINNKTSVTWEDGDYEVTYSYLTEYWDADGEQDRWFPKKAKGTRVGPNETVTITDKNDGWEFKNVKFKTKLSKEDFAERFKEQTVFDKAQNKFVPKDSD